MTTTTSPAEPTAGIQPRPHLVLRLLRGPDSDSRWARPALFALLALTAVLYLWDLARNGFANDFYTAAAQAGTRSWKAFFFGSFDTSNFITVDRAPASLWVMEISGRVFGLNPWSILVPQALEGVASVALLYAAVRRWFGPAAALISGLVLALTPAAALMFRFNNPDALLVLLLTAAAYTLVRAVENGRTKWLVACGVLVGFAFLAKLMQAFLVVPGFAVTYLVAGPPRLGKRLWQLILAGAGVIAGAGWWVLAAELTPAADRPYFGGSTNNSILQLAVGFDGLGRLTGDATGLAGFGPDGPGVFFGGRTGLFRLFNTQFGGQASWLLPAALVALAAMVLASRRAARTDRTRAAALMWGGWVLVTGLVLSYMQGIVHTYYTVALVPGLGALIGIGATMWWRARASLPGRAAMAATVAGTGWWAFVLLDRTPQWLPWLRWSVAAAGTAGAVAVLAWPHLDRMTRLTWSPGRRLWLAVIPAALATFAGFAGPAAYSLATVNAWNAGPYPSAGPQPGMASQDTGNIAADLNALAAMAMLIAPDGASYRWAAATTGSFAAAPLELATGDAVMAIGGFAGVDPWPTLAVFEGLAARHEVHYYLSMTGDLAGEPDSPAIARWVASHFKGQVIDGETVYDLTKPAR